MANTPTVKKINTKFSLYSLITVARPIHWVKNFSIFAALVFSGQLFWRARFIYVFWAFLAFNFITSATYIFNDLIDAKRDRLHPIKKNRPIASGKIPISFAVIELIVLVAMSLKISYHLPYLFFILVIFYFVLQVAYSLFLKNLAVIDILIIASGFVIRVYAGAFAIDAHLSVWFLLCVISTALFLASGKRRAELGVMGTSGQTRKSLAKYSPELLNSYVTMFGSASWIAWALFTFFESPSSSTPLWIFLAEISKATTITKLLMITIPVTIFGIMRYEALIFEGRAEAPEKLLLKDVALVSSVIVWILMVVLILYGGIATG
ncbi:decaprenyl-phosphate phosphoribosyltransferase [Candidatus Woesebacteria bacterium]|nr:decaprenyl-phosphate phosphoribosyltransferase [Candidatus Woesebacteria bacterium]QQG47716.1 MAG: decaprenyl-phosphate phosphoribosyltransferase [Candidatus Woesebacteria bacterium]